MTKTIRLASEAHLTAGERETETEKETESEREEEENDRPKSVGYDKNDKASE
jgi:hypothetical protein